MLPGFHFVNDLVDESDIRIHWVPSRSNLADVFTKALPLPLLRTMRDMLSLC